MQLTYFEASDSWMPVWAPDGSKIIFYNGNGYDLYSINYNGGNIKNLTNHPAVDWNPTISPNGEHIAFQSERNMNQDICVIDTNGSNFFNLTDDENSNIGPVWSPDGKMILYHNGTDKNLYVINSDGSGKKLITNTESYFQHQWIEDSQRIIYQTRNGRIYKIDIKGTNKVLLTDTTRLASFPNYCAANSKIVFTYRVGPNVEIWEVSIDGSHHSKIISLDGEGTEPVYSPNGKRILFRDGIIPNMYIVDPDGKNKRKVTDNENTVFERYYSWSPVKLEN